MRLPLRGVTLVAAVAAGMAAGAAPALAATAAPAAPAAAADHAPAWKQVAVPAILGVDPQLSQVAAVSATNAWAVGSSLQSGITQPVVLHWDGTAWSVFTTAGIQGDLA